MNDIKLSKQFSFIDFGILFLAFCLFVFAGIIHQRNTKPIVVIEKQQSAINLNQNILLFFNLGNKRLLADLLWIQTLLESDQDHYKKNDLNSWMYLRFLSISSLDPKFYENYMYGGLYLSIVKDDVLGAAEIFEKGLAFYPKDYKLNYYAGFNYYFEQGNFEKGLIYLERIKNHPKAPPFIKLIVGKLKFETSQNADIALTFLKNEYNESKDEFLKQKIKSDIYALQAETDLQCLNSKKNECNKVDADGKSYLFQSGVWKSQRPFSPYKIHTPNKK
jgi:tetratricopeptide (TPR) repeat protein